MDDLKWLSWSQRLGSEGFLLHGEDQVLLLLGVHAPAPAILLSWDGSS